MSLHPEYPRALRPIERELVDLLLPPERPGYAALREQLDGLVVLGTGRWGAGDFVLGKPGQPIDQQAPMQPVFALGGAVVDREGRQGEVTVSIHERDDEGRIEMHVSGLDVAEFGESLSAQWTLSRWSPGDPAPQSDECVREIALDAGSRLVLAVAPQRRQLWLHDALAGTNRLIPVTSFYNELMLEIGERDPRIALDHRRLFAEDVAIADADLRAAFRRYNMVFRKIEPERLEREGQEGASDFQSRITRWFRRTGRGNGRA
jgi:hypothetical protein